MTGNKVAWPKTAKYRYALGLPVFGHWQTNADWFSWGDKPTGRRPPRELGGLKLGYRPGYQRMLFRWSLTAGGAYELIGWSTHPWETGFNTAAGVAAVSGAYGYRAWLAHSQQTSEPARNALQLQLSKLLDTPYPEASVTREGTVTVELPRTFVLAESSARALNDIVERTMGHELEVSWPNLLKSRTVTWNTIPEPPNHVQYASVRDFMVSLPPGTVYLGDDRRNRHVTVNLDSETPHIGLSMGTGRGKSVLFRLLIAQLLAQGADITILDVGQISLHEFRSTEGVKIEYDVQRCWDQVTLYVQEMGERLTALREVDEEEWPDIMAKWRRRVLFIEELNNFFSESKRYWDSIRTSKDPASPPVLNDLTQVSVMARKVLMHLAVSSQRLEAKLISAAARGQMGLKVLANPTAADWRMHGEGKRPRGSYSRRAGRVAAVVAGEATAIQVGFMTRAEAKEHVLTYRSVLAGVAPSYLATDQGTTQSVSYDIAELITLREFSEKHGESLTALQRAVQRASLPSHGTANGAKLYRPEDIRDLRAGTGRFSPYDDSEVVVDSD